MSLNTKLPIDYSKGSLASFIPTDVNQGWVIGPTLLIRNIEYLATSLSFSSEILENKFYNLVTKIFSDVNYLQALQTEYLKLPSGTVTLANIDDYVESLYQAIILYAIIDEFTPSILNNVSKEAEDQILKILNLVISSGFQEKLDTAFTTMDFSALSNTNINQFIDDIYNTLGSEIIPRPPTFELKNTTPNKINISVNVYTKLYINVFDNIEVDNPSVLQDIKSTFRFDPTDDSGIGYNFADWSFISGRLTEEKGFTLYTDIAGNNTTSILQILPGTQITFVRPIPGSNLFIVNSNRSKTHPPVNLICDFTDPSYIDDTVLDTTGQILGKRSIKISVEYKNPLLSATSLYYTDSLISIDTKTWPYDQVIPIQFAGSYVPPATLRLANLANPMHSVSTNLTDIGLVSLDSGKFGIKFIPNPGVDLQTALPGKYFEYDWVEVDTNLWRTHHSRYTFISRLVPDTSKQSIFEISNTNFYQVKLDSYYPEAFLENLLSRLTFNYPEEVYNLDYVFSIDKSVSDASWTLTYLNGIYTFDCPKVTIKIRRCLSFSNNYEFYYVYKGLSTLNEYTYAEIQTLPLVINISIIDREKYINDSTIDSSSKIYGKRDIKFEPVSHYRGIYTNTFEAPQTVEIKLNKNFSGFVLPTGDGGSLIQYITAKYLIDPTKKDNINITVTVVSTTLPASQVLNVTGDKLYFNSIDTLASPLDRTQLDQNVLDILDAKQISEIGALYCNKEVKIRIQINEKVTNNVLLDAIQTIKFIPHIV